MPDCPASQASDRFASHAMVSIHVPICNEAPEQVCRLLAALAALDYPAFEVLVVDHNTADPKLWEPAARDCARYDARFRFFHLGPLPSGRAGALNFARAQANDQAEVVAVLDANVDVPRHWLRDATSGFADPRVGIVRAPCLVRKSALDSVGGWAEWAITEDAALDLALSQGGWLAAAPAVAADRGPVDFTTMRLQAARRAYGAAQIVRRCWRPLFSPLARELTRRQRWHVVAGWLPWAGDALALMFLLMNLTLTIGLSLAPWRFGAPVILCTLLPLGLLACRLARARTAGPGAVITELALSHTVARAFWNGLLGRNAPSLHPADPRQEPSWADGLSREEFALLLLTWAALAGIATMDGLATWQAILWCAALLTQSVPYLAAISITARTALRKWRSMAARPSLRPVARTGAGD